MVDDEKQIGKIETPPVGKRIESDAPHQRASVEAEAGLKGSPLASGEGRQREDEEIFQAIHDTINHGDPGEILAANGRFRNDRSFGAGFDAPVIGNRQYHFDIEWIDLRQFENGILEIAGCEFSW